MIKNFTELLKQAKKQGPKCVALASAHDEAALSALVAAKKQGLAEGRLFGDRERIQKILREINSDEHNFLCVEHQPDETSAAERAVLSVKNNEADILLKGRIKTSAFLKCVLHPEAGLRTGRLLSDVFLFEDPRRKGNRLLMITDGGVTLCPDLKQKIAILRNAVAVAHKLGNDQPKVAILSAVETVQPELSSTTDAALMARMNERGQINGCVVDGPLALDNALCPEAARSKNLDSPVAGQADILLCPTIESANMLAKSTTYFAGFRLAHVIMGAEAPVLIPSRADSADAKLLSIALGIAVSSKLDKHTHLTHSQKISSEP